MYANHKATLTKKYGRELTKHVQNSREHNQALLSSASSVLAMALPEDFLLVFSVLSVLLQTCYHYTEFQVKKEGRREENLADFNLL